MTSPQAFPVLRRADPTAFFTSQAPAPALPPAIHCGLPEGRAVTLRTRQPGVLRVVQGGAWLTFGNAGNDGQPPAGDHFLACGDSLRLSAGQTVVAEFWRGGGRNGASEAQACLAWEPAPPCAVRAGVKAAWRAGLRAMAGPPALPAPAAQGLRAFSVLKSCS